MGFIKRIKEGVKSIIEGPFQNRQKILLHERKGYSLDDFIGYFDVPQFISVAIWEVFLSEANVEEFKPKPEDDITYIFGVDDEDLEDLIVDVLGHCDKVLPEQSQLKMMNPIVTIEDLVLFISLCPSDDKTRS